MYKMKQCWRCLLHYSVREFDKQDCPRCGITVTRLKGDLYRKRKMKDDVQRRIDTPEWVLLKCALCDKYKSFNDTTVSWTCGECYSTKLEHKCDLCDGWKPDDVGFYVSPMGFWICDTCNAKFEEDRKWQKK